MTRDSYNTYKTTDKYFAAYLMLRGQYCLKAIPAANPTQPYQKQFIFIDIDNPKQYEDSYFRSEREEMSAYAYARRLMYAGKILKDSYDEDDMARLKHGG